MLVSHRYKFIYTKTVKTAGTSVEGFFDRFCMLDGEWQESHYRDEYESAAGIVGYRGLNKPQDAKWYNHMPASLIKQQLGDDIWSSYFKFCVVRDPFEKCVSSFEHQGREHTIRNRSLRKRIITLGMSEEQRRFLDFLESAPPVDRNKYVIDGAFCLDDVIRYESLVEDVERICGKLSLPFEQEDLPKFKTGYRRSEATVQSLFTPKAIKKVRQLFAYEFERFGYSTQPKAVSRQPLTAASA